MKWILTGSLILLLFSFLPAQEKELRPYKLINADTLRVNNINDEYVSHLIGNVHFFYGDTEFFANEAVLYEVQKITSMTGNVKVYDDTLSLEADEVEYFRLQEKLLLTGNVLATEVHADSTIRTFAADEIEYLRNEKELTALRNVKAFDEREELYGTCHRLKYYQDEGYGYLLEEPEMILASRDSLALSAEKIEYFEEFQKIAASFNVLTESNDFTVSSDFLLYFSELNKAIYLGEPQFTSDFTWASANEFRIFFEESKISKAQLIDFCEVFFRTEEQEDLQNWVTADEILFNFVEGKIVSSNAMGNVDSYFQQDEADRQDYVENRVQGKEMFLRIDNNKIIDISLKEKVKGVYKFKQK